MRFAHVGSCRRPRLGGNLHLRIIKRVLALWTGSKHTDAPYLVRRSWLSPNVLRSERVSASSLRRAARVQRHAASSQSLTMEAPYIFDTHTQILWRHIIAKHATVIPFSGHLPTRIASWQ